MKISKDRLLHKTTSHEPEFVEALELLVNDINANDEINIFGIIAFMHQLHNRMNVREKIHKFSQYKDMPDPAAPVQQLLQRERQPHHLRRRHRDRTLEGFHQGFQGQDQLEVPGREGRRAEHVSNLPQRILRQPARWQDRQFLRIHG